MNYLGGSDCLEFMLIFSSYLNLQKKEHFIKGTFKCLISWKLGTLDYNINVFIHKCGGKPLRKTQYVYYLLSTSVSLLPCVGFLNILLVPCLVYIYLALLNPWTICAYKTHVGMLSQQTSSSGVILFPQLRSFLLESSTPYFSPKFLSVLI